MIPAEVIPKFVRPIVLAPFGRHTRYLLSGYLRNVFTVLSILLAIALTIDLWPQYEMVASHGASGLGAFWSVVRFAGLRTPGLIAPLLPFATFIGVVWTEVAHTQSGERMLVWNSGRSPLHCLAPALFLGLILGAADFAMDAYLGPSSMGIQMRERLGRDGERLDRGTLSKPAWIALSNGLVKASIEFGPPPVLHDLAFFRRDSDGRLLEVDTAPRAELDPASGLWRLKSGHHWSLGEGDVPVAAGGATRQTMVPFDERNVALKLNPLWLSWYNVVPQYIPLPILRELAASRDIPDAHGQYATQFYVIIAEALLPAGMALLAASLAMLLLAYDVSAAALIGIVFSGYIAHFAIKAGLILGQNGVIPPLFAGFTVPVLLALAITGVLVVCKRQSRGR